MPGADYLNAVVCWHWKPRYSELCVVNGFLAFCLALKTELVRVKKLMEEKRKKEKAIYSKLFTSWRGNSLPGFAIEIHNWFGEKASASHSMRFQMKTGKSWKLSLWKLLCNKPYIENKKYVTICQMKTCRLLLQWVLYFSQIVMKIISTILERSLMHIVTWAFFIEISKCLEGQEPSWKILWKLKPLFRVGRRHIFAS